MDVLLLAGMWAAEFVGGLWSVRWRFVPVVMPGGLVWAWLWLRPTGKRRRPRPRRFLPLTAPPAPRAPAPAVEFEDEDTIVFQRVTYPGAEADA